ncbi:MAG: TM0106 family RecB-like putative nuclease [Actinomycetota bacterium]
MLRINDDTLVLAATDLSNHLACAHLTQQRLAIARGERGKPRPSDDPHADLIRARGEAHEQEQLHRLSAACGGHIDLSTAAIPYTREALEAATEATAAAMREGAPLIYQAQFFDGRWQGRTDFLRRVDAPSDLGRHSYEVIDTKLARQVKPHVIHQLSLYNRLLAHMQGLEPELGYVILGDGSEVALELRRYAALHRHVARNLERVASQHAQPTYPEPVAHCEICALASECYERRVADDHLSLVAHARREHRDQLVEIGIPTVLALAEADDTDPGPLGLERFELLHEQAALQVASRESGEPRHRHLPPARAAGYAVLLSPSEGDIFFDLEGDPYIGDGGIEYLWGWWTAEAGYECIWAHDPEAEKAAFEQFVDRLTELRRHHPDLHVFHYAPHERAKLRSLSIEYATREEEIDELLRGEVFVDLYAVVRHALQVGEESYSLKKLERHHDFERLERRVREGGGSIVAYETWLETQDPELLEAIRAYNEEDCRSTLSLRDWLLEKMRPEAEAELGVDFEDYRTPEPEEEHGPPPWMADAQALIDGLEDGLPADSSEDTTDQAERRLISNLLLYHRREGKPTWWRHFDLRGKPVSELIDERDALAGLVRDESLPPVPVKRSLEYAFTFPAQEFRLDLGDVIDPTTDETHKLVAIDDDHVVLRRGANAPAPAPRALIPGRPIEVAVLRNGLMALAQSVLARDGKSAAVRAMLRREPPRLKSGHLREGTEALVSATLGLDRSILPVQGPPGTGKTHWAARMIVAALADGRRVGVTAPSHAAIQTLLRMIESHATDEGMIFAGIYKGDDYESTHDLVEVTGDNAKVTEDYQLVAGTAWLFAREEHREKFDLLFIDEAGQYALANAAAAGLCASNLVFLGDPQQLPQVTQAEHPGGSGASVLEHLLEGAATISSERGVLLTETWRMHPDVCAFVSERSYDSRLHSRPACTQRSVEASAGALSRTGLRAIAIDHDGRSQASPEEADAIAQACRDLLQGATVTDDEGETHDLAPEDILVVAPYNLAVRSIRERVPADVKVGTVDRFQGQQAPVVFYAMTCSSGEDAPRGIDFLFDSHRLNVAISRAQCLAVLVHSPRLLDADCPTLEAMELVDGVCRFVEMAEAVEAPVFGERARV